MTSQRILVGVATAQLAAQLVGMSVAVRRGLPYDVRVVGMRGEADDIGRDLWDKGTALSAPVTMLGTQAVAIALVATNPNASVGRVAAKVLGGLGALNIGGYLGERVVRRAAGTTSRRRSRLSASRSRPPWPRWGSDGSRVADPNP